MRDSLSLPPSPLALPPPPPPPPSLQFPGNISLRVSVPKEEENAKFNFNGQDIPLRGVAIRRPAADSLCTDPRRCRSSPIPKSPYAGEPPTVYARTRDAVEARLSPSRHTKASRRQSMHGPEKL